MIRTTDHPDMTPDVYHRLKATNPHALMQKAAHKESYWIVSTNLDAVHLKLHENFLISVKRQID